MKHRFHRALAIWFAIALAVMFSVAAIAYAAFLQTAQTESEVVHTHSVIDNLSDILVELANLQIGAYGYTITGTVAFLEPYDAGRARLDPLVDRLRQRVQDNPLQAKRADCGDLLADSERRLAPAHRAGGAIGRE